VLLRVCVCSCKLDDCVVVQSKDLHGAIVDMTTDGVEETTVVTATVLGMEEGPELAGKTTVCFWVCVANIEVEPSLDRAALL